MDIEKFNELVAEFESHWGEDPIEYNENGVIAMKIYEVQRLDSIFQSGKRNTMDQIVQRTDYFSTIIFGEDDIDELKEYLSMENFTLVKELKNFADLQQIKKKYLSITNNVPNGYNINDVVLLDRQKYRNYRQHLNKVKMIGQKARNIVRDKFQLDEFQNSASVDTSAIFSNLGYIVKGFEGKYIALSKGDRVFVKNFMDEQIRDGVYRLTIKETLPLYKEGIQDIINIGNGILKLTPNKMKIKIFSKNFLGEEKSTLESCWQCYFDKYLRVLLMDYKEFYPQTVFAPMDGYEKEARPDFLAVDLYNNVDVIEIKHHRTTLLRKEAGRDSYYPSSDLTKAIFQLNKYLDLGSSNVKTNFIKNDYTKSLIENNKIYRPRGILIISSRDHITSEKTDDELTSRLEKEIKKLKTAYNNIDIVLFDELLTNLRNYVDFLDITLEK